jgi:signal transduction histidine kinase
VNEELDALIARNRNNPALQHPASPNLAYYVAHSVDDRARLPLPLRALDEGHHEIGSGTNERHVGVRRVEGTTFIVAYDAGPHEVREEEFQQFILIALGIVVLVALALGYWLAGLLTRQVTDLAGRLQALRPEAADPPLARPGQDPEVASLARVLDEYRARIARMIRREQEFTANASHELRTPLTAIRTSCELLLADAALPEKARNRLEMIDAAAQRMSDQIQVFMFLGREQTLGASESVLLAECVSKAAEPYRGELVRKGVEFTIDVEPTSTLQVNRQALDIVLANLIRNAMQHTERGFVKVVYMPERLTVSDSGAGIAAKDVGRLFERFYRATGQREGFGLGLAIVKRVCDLHGWVIDLETQPGRGSAFSISFR